MKKQAAREESREIASCRLQESDSKMARAEKQPANSRCIKSRRSGNGCSSLCSRSSPSRRRFISTVSFGAGSSIIPIAPAKQFMRNVSRFGDWPEHIAAGLLLVAIAWWRGSKRWVRIGLTMILACALAGIAARGLKIATGRARPRSNRNSAGTARGLVRNTIRSPADILPRRRLFRRPLLCQPRLGLCLLPIPLLIAASRMYVAAHYLSDVVCAAVIGISAPGFAHAVPASHQQQLTAEGVDSNPRGLAPAGFQTGAINHSTTPPKMLRFAYMAGETRPH